MKPIDPKLLEKEAIRRLEIRGIIDPRLRPSMDLDYTVIRRYDALLASEIVNLSRYKAFSDGVQE